MQNHKLLTLRVVLKQAGTLFWLLSKKLLRKRKWLKIKKSQFSRAKWRNSPKSRGTSWQSKDYCSEDCFLLTCQILCDFDSVTQMISISVFLPYAISDTLESLGRPRQSVLHHFDLSLEELSVRTKSSLLLRCEVRVKIALSSASLSNKHGQTLA